MVYSLFSRDGGEPMKAESVPRFQFTEWYLIEELKIPIVPVETKSNLTPASRPHFFTFPISCDAEIAAPTDNESWNDFRKPVPHQEEVCTRSVTMSMLKRWQ
jgi:hypothetical protein